MLNDKQIEHIEGLIKHGTIPITRYGWKSLYQQLLFLAWRPIEIAPKGKWKEIPALKGTRKVFEPEKIFLILNGQMYLTWALENGRWNGLADSDKPTHWLPYDFMPLPKEGE